MENPEFESKSYLDLAAWQAVREKIAPYIHRTPVMTSSAIDSMAGCSVFFKCENLQKIGAFKMRGAMNAALNLPPEALSKGLATHSSGNFAQAVALSAKLLGVPAYIVMPENAPQVKKDAVKGYGGIVIECESTQAAREAAVEEVVREKGATFLHPYNDWNVIYGQGTAAAELLEDVKDLDFILAPVGGGGLMSGTAMAAAAYAPRCMAFGTEPVLAGDAYMSLHKGSIQKAFPPKTIADGLRTSLGDKTLYTLSRYLKDILLVDEPEIVEAMRLVWERMKIVIEPSSAVPLAAVLHNPELFAGSRVGIILSGGNVDAGVFFRQLEEQVKNNTK
mgnify:CR=1 FL=1